MLKKLFLVIGCVAMFLAGQAKAEEVTGLFNRPLKVYNTINIDEDRLLVLKGPVQQMSIDPIVEDLVKMDRESKKAIYLVLNSPGGSVVDGMNLVNAIKSSKSPIVCVIDTEAYSMAAIIATYCTKTYIQKYAAMMFHRATYGVQGHPQEVETRVAFIKKYFDLLNSEIARNLGLSTAKYEELIENEFWLTAEDAVRFGAADGVINKLQYPYEAPNPFFSILFGGMVERLIELEN